MLARRQLCRLGILGLAYPAITLARANVPGNTVHVSTSGHDEKDGARPEAAVRTFARAMSLAAAGSAIKLKRGDTWNERLHIGKNNIRVGAYGTGANPRVDGDRSRYCIWVSAANAEIADIDCIRGRSGVLIQGVGASATVRRGQFSECGTGISAGGGGKKGWGGPGLGPHVYGQLILADGVTCINNRRALGAADGIQIGEDATADATHTIRNATCQYNEWGGVNAKAGTVVVENSNLSFNGQTGWTAQNNLKVLHISNCIIEGNSAAEQGTPQASVEDSAVVRSRRNIYKNPHNATNGQYTLHIRVVGQPDSPYPQKPTLHCLADTFISRIRQALTLGSIGVHTVERFPATVSVIHCTFDHEKDTGIAIDGYACPQLDLTVKNSIFRMTNGLALRLHPSAKFAGQIDYNLYFGFLALVAIRNERTYPLSKLRNLFADYGIERHVVVGDPLFRDAGAGDYRLKKESPAARAGAVGLGIDRDAKGVSYRSPPDLGAHQGAE